MDTKFKEPEYITKLKRKLSKLTLRMRLNKSFNKHSMKNSKFTSKDYEKMRSIRNEITLIQTILMQFNQMKKMYHRGKKWIAAQYTSTNILRNLEERGLEKWVKKELLNL